MGRSCRYGCRQCATEKCTEPSDALVTLTMYAPLGATAVEDAGTRARAFQESEPAPQSCRPPRLSNAARSMASFPDALLDVIVPLQRNRSLRSFSARLNFPFLIGIRKPWKLNSVVITSPVTGHRAIWLMKIGSNIGPLAV